MGASTTGLSIAGMAGKSSSQLKLGQWLRALGRTQAELARGTGMNEGYISQLVSGEKTNLGTDKLLEIATFLRVPPGSLFKNPPSQETLAKLTPAHIEALGTLLEEFGGDNDHRDPKGPKSRR